MLVAVNDHEAVGVLNGVSIRLVVNDGIQCLALVTVYVALIPHVLSDYICRAFSFLAICELDRMQPSV
jgi:hypothetical protein